jgi:hypothetical protein
MLSTCRLRDVDDARFEHVDPHRPVPARYPASVALWNLAVPSRLPLAWGWPNPARVPIRPAVAPRIVRTRFQQFEASFALAARKKRGLRRQAVILTAEESITRA